MNEVKNYLLQMLKFSPYKILGIWLLDFLYSLISILTPMLIGLVIDDLASGNYEMFLVFLVVLLIEVFLGFLYRRYDTRIYERISVQFKEKYFENAIEQEIKISEIDANSELIDDFSEFLRFFVLRLMSTFSIIIPLIYLHFEVDICVMLAAIVTITIALFVQNPLQRGMQQEISRIRDENEKRRDIIGKRDLLPYSNFLNRVMGFTVKHSDKDAIAYTVSLFLQLGLLAFTAWHIVSSSSVTTGVIFAAITYIMKLNEKSCELPEIYADYLLLKDGINRIRRTKSM